MPVRICTTEGAGRIHHYQCLLEDPEIQWVGQISGPYTDKVLGSFDALVVSCEYPVQTRLAIAACKQRGIPTFHVLDGILEWRNLFENPRSTTLEAGAPLFQPLLADYTFTMGERQHETLKWLGNDSTYVTGLPRFDSLATARRHQVMEATGRVLVATARTPWFDEEQKKSFLGEFAELVGSLSASKLVNSISWRVAPDVARHCNLPFADTSSLAEQLDGVDAVITSPSTLMIEAMMLGIPVMVFDPFQRPSLNQSAWFAGSACEVVTLLGSLLEASRERLSFQDYLLTRLARKDESAGKRICHFIKSIVKDGLVPEEYCRIAVDTKISTLDKKMDISEGQAKALLNTIPALERELFRLSSELKNFKDADNRRFIRRLKRLGQRLYLSDKSGK